MKKNTEVLKFKIVRENGKIDEVTKIFEYDNFSQLPFLLKRFLDRICGGDYVCELPSIGSNGWCMVYCGKGW